MVMYLLYFLKVKYAKVMRQVNCTTSVDDISTYWISEYSEDGYVGILTDTIYEDGCDYTDWCQFVGTQEECEAYIEAKEG